MKTETRVNLACGDVVSEGWLNFDYSPASREVVKANLLRRLPLADDSVDVVYSSHFLEHVPKRQVEKVLSECFRVLRPQGYIRLVLPDLEEMCQEYLHQRQTGNSSKAEFMVLEILDQCVRTVSGGELGAFFNRLRNDSLSPEMRDYVTQRTGEAITAPSQRPRTGNQLFRALRHPGKLLRKLERLYCYLITLLLPRAFREQNISFSQVGERHAWLYDFQALSILLEGAGFVSVRRVSFNSSDIVEFPFHPLDMTRDGKPRKGRESMYVEARKL